MSADGDPPALVPLPAPNPPAGPLARLWGKASRSFEDIDLLDGPRRRWEELARTARIVLSSREMGRIYHAKGVERLVRNDLWRGRSAERFYDAMEWLYGWNVKNCLAPDEA